MNNAPQVQCPTCKKVGTWFASSFGPFCSQRCKLIDLGDWLGEKHKFSTPLRPGHLEKYADLPPGEHLDRPDDEASEEP